MFNISDQVPKELVDNIAFIDGVLCCSDARRGDPQLISFLSLARRQGVEEHRFVPAEEFLGKYRAANTTTFIPTARQDSRIVNRAFLPSIPSVSIPNL